MNSVSAVADAEGRVVELGRDAVHARACPEQRLPAGVVEGREREEVRGRRADVLAQAAGALGRRKLVVVFMKSIPNRNQNRSSSYSFIFK